MYVSTYTKLCDIDFDEFKDYYNTHSQKETLEYFNINGDHLRQFCKDHNWKKSKKLSYKIYQKTYFDKTGYYSPFQNPEVIAINKSKEVKEKRRNSQKATLLDKYGVETLGELQVTKNSHYTDTFGANVSNGLSKLSDDEWKLINEKRADTCKLKYGIDYYVLTDQCRKRGKCSIYKYDNEYFDSKYELFLWIYAVDHGESIIHEPIKLVYSCDNKDHYYFPDFMYNGELVEVKGYQFFNEDGTMCNPYDHSKDKQYEAKRKCMLDNNVKILLPDDCKVYKGYFMSKGYRLEDYRWQKTN